MYELLTFVLDDAPRGRDGKSRPYVIVEYPSRVVYTFGKKDKALAEEILDRLNNPELIELDDDESLAASV